MKKTENTSNNVRFGFTLAEGATHVNLPPTKAKFGFTLAEVLITLGIIGVVAAMTIPTLMSNYRKHIIETRLTKFYSTMTQAIKLAENDYDDISGWDKLGRGFVKDDDGNDTTTPVAEAWVNKYIIPYIKSDVKMKNNAGKIELYFVDGSVLMISSTSWLYFPDAKKYKLDDNGNINQEETAGKDMFIFLLNTEADVAPRPDRIYMGHGLQPYKYNWNGTREDLFNNAHYGCGKEGVIGAYCTELIRQNGWKIPNDYPIKI